MFSTNTNTLTKVLAEHLVRFMALAIGMAWKSKRNGLAQLHSATDVRVGAGVFPKYATKPFHGRLITICSSSYGGSCANASCVCGSQFCAFYVFFHKAW